MAAMADKMHLWVVRHEEGLKGMVIGVLIFLALFGVIFLDCVIHGGTISY